MRIPLLAGNWKMNKNIQEALSLVVELKQNLSEVRDREILVCPPFTALSRVSKELNGSNIAVGAQNIYNEKPGAFTGEISGDMVKEVAEYVILGHSERRQYFNETNELINKKIKAALGYGLKVILCVGEHLPERQSGNEKTVVEEQLKGCLSGIQGLKNIVVAYEPVWAIGTGETATPEQAQEMHRHIRGLLQDSYDEQAASTRVIYGGSVNPDNIKDLMAKEDIDGALVGGASLKADSFTKIVKY